MKNSTWRKGRINKKPPKPRPFLVELENKITKERLTEKMHNVKKILKK